MSISDQLIYECGKETERSKTNGKVLLRLLKMMKGGFFLYLASIIAMSLSMSGFNIIIAFLLKNIIQMAQSGSYQGLLSMVLINIAQGLGALLIYAISFYTYTIQAKKGCANLQKAMLNKAMRMPFYYYENTHSGDFMSKLMYDCGRTEDVYGSRFRRILMPCLMVLFYLVPMFYLSWQVTACLVGVSIITFIINGLFINPMKKVSKELSDSHMSLTERLTNILSGIELVKIFNLDKKLVDQYVEDNERFKKGQKRMNMLSAGLESLNECFNLLSSLVFIAISIFFVSLGITTLDKLAAIYLMYGSMSWNFLQIGIYIPSMANCLINGQKVLDFIDSKEEPERYAKVGKAAGDGFIEMEHVDFSYEEGLPVLKDFNLHIEKGSIVALKGESGKGKSTIAKIMLGFYPIQKGNITIDGKAFSEMPLSVIRNMIGYVPQEPYLYDVSIAENIGYGKPGATSEEIYEAAKAANAHDFIIKQEKGYETKAGERGNRLSGGEKQRIAIARAILKNAPILILDEATSALDNESERLVNEALERLMAGRTIIMIAHRQSTLKRADVIVEI
ncbi:ABC transporter ATP-binding protein [Lachnoclostridium phytofermentans]|uniref:ABC transporter ATP-binding protein n=1 Tax=Lachnoclostridium phytofermentans TaxID=66219 RepID=UPI0004952032|nr:ABC transporter ATP-binding protein [Lachnoclostridium phytofermentans]